MLLARPLTRTERALTRFARDWMLLACPLTRTERALTRFARDWMLLACPLTRTERALTRFARDWMLLARPLTRTERGAPEARGAAAGARRALRAREWTRALAEGSSSLRIFQRIDGWGRSGSDRRCYHEAAEAGGMASACGSDESERRA